MYDEILALLRLPKDKVLRAIVLLRKDGYSKQEVAGKLALALQSVNRLLKPLRDKWLKRNGENYRESPPSAAKTVNWGFPVAAPGQPHLQRASPLTR